MALANFPNSWMTRSHISTDDRKIWRKCHMNRIVRWLIRLKSPESRGKCSLRKPHTNHKSRLPSTSAYTTSNQRWVSSSNTKWWLTPMAIRLRRVREDLRQHANSSRSALRFRKARVRSWRPNARETLWVLSSRMQIDAKTTARSLSSTWLSTANLARQMANRANLRAKYALLRQINSNQLVRKARQIFCWSGSRRTLGKSFCSSSAPIWTLGSAKSPWLRSCQRWASSKSITILMSNKSKSFGSICNRLAASSWCSTMNNNSLSTIKRLS